MKGEREESGDSLLASDIMSHTRNFYTYLYVKSKVAQLLSPSAYLYRRRFVVLVLDEKEKERKKGKKEGRTVLLCAITFE